MDDDTEPVLKLDDEQRRAFGWASVAVTKSGEVVTDAHQDQLDPADLEEAGYAFVAKYRTANEMHTGPVIGELIESVVITDAKKAAMGIAPDAVPNGWWVGFQIDNEDAWSRVKAGELRAFSIEGRAVREEIDQ